MYNIMPELLKFRKATQKNTQAYILSLLRAMQKILRSN